MIVPDPINYVCDYVDNANDGYYEAVYRMLFVPRIMTTRIGLSMDL